ncbi:ATP-binding cassette domain-containing protein [Corynebacterium propinquum]|uniref:ATP-binding cassette domain-containing protein n=1 Tax=Corynebacterium propinquum TaxID=43769 RepID=A0ABT7G0U4_9CORY|nr:ATP-binding cassette domain-containing protein [Corynebacterium propinquum]MDK4233915.1 ATP-binding cassette domain-containing protein [Corynebacterium propinquum]MDK4238822.1 ATP-binding cassette domain-containing protein [Corynebacterium propinquum]MDK4300353.1 ATP-binding cassette domain-containing protein [Corynebacterium propinquum]MDK4312892.1 ATP-binding cassette domain-containing protein [Corynebacterium propinquum]
MAHTHSADWTPHPVRPKNPIALVFLAAIAVVTVLGPLSALIFRVPWDRFVEITTEASTLEALKLSLYAAVLSTTITLALGIPLSLWLLQNSKSGWFIRLLVVLPLAMPPVVAGLALTAAIGRRSYTSGILDALGIDIAFTFSGVVASHVFITLPFIIVSADSALRQINQEIIDSALSIGMSYPRVIWRVILPTILPAIVTGAGLGLARSLGEFGATLTFAGSLPGETRTLPLAIYLNREVDADIAYVQAALLIFIAIVVLCLSGLPTVLKKRHKRRVSRNIGLNRQRLSVLTAATTTPVGIKVNGCDVQAGQTTAVVGSNGAGKTTLMKAIAGRLGGADVEFVDDNGNEYRKQPKVIILTQNPALPPASTVLQAVTMATRDTDRAKELLAAAGLSELQAVPVPALSGGQSRQVAIVRAIAASPEVLILDEPFAGLDSSIAAQWKAYFRTTSQQRTTLLVTHNGHDISSLSDYVMSIASGKIVAYDKTTELTAAPSTKFLATTLGLNAVAAHIMPGLDTDNAGNTSTQINCGEFSLKVATEGLALGGDGASARTAHGTEVLATWLPSDAWLSQHEPASNSGTQDNSWTGRITDISVPHPTVCDVTVDTHGEQVDITISPQDAHELGLELDEQITWGIDPAKISVTALAAEDRTVMQNQPNSN